MELILTSRGDLQDLIQDAIKRTSDLKKPHTQVNGSVAKNWLTTNEVIAFLGVSRPTLSRFRAKKILPYSKIGKAIYYRRADIEKMLQDNMKCHGEEGVR